jgi:hypothetical protein
MAKRFFATKLGAPGKRADIIVKDHTFIGRGSEKEVHDVKVVFERGAKKRSKPFALKKFNEIQDHEHPWCNPVQQVKNYNALKKLNSDRKLGLKMIDTFRLIDAPGRTPGILATRLMTFSWRFFPKLPAEYREKVITEIQRQMTVVRENGYMINMDAFVLVQKGTEIVPVIADFKFIHPRVSKEDFERTTAAIREHAEKHRR